MNPQLTITGTIATEPTLEYRADDDFAREQAFTAATTFEIRNGTSTATVTALSKLAENVVESLRVGDEVVVVGVLVSTDGHLHITARDVGVSLRTAIAQPHRTTYQRIALERGVA